MTVTVKKIDDLRQLDISKLVEESEAEGYRFLRRLTEQYEDGTNRFDKPGEVLCGVWDASGTLIAVGGLNIDPFSPSDRTGRLRRFYVCMRNRRDGIGTQLLKEIIRHAEGRFDELVLRTDSAKADAFYCANGFVYDHSRPEITHRMQLRREAAEPAS